MCVCVCVCVCERERERERGGFFKNNFIHLFIKKSDTSSLPVKSLHFRLSPFLLPLLIEAVKNTVFEHIFKFNSVL